MQEALRDEGSISGLQRSLGAESDSQLSIIAQKIAWTEFNMTERLRTHSLTTAQTHREVQRAPSSLRTASVDQLLPCYVCQWALRTLIRMVNR